MAGQARLADQRQAETSVPYRNLLIDFDHTLFDSDASETAALKQAFAAVGRADAATHEAAYQRINRRLWRRVERGELPPQAVRLLRFRELVDSAGLDADAVTMAEAFVQGLAEHGELYPDAIGVLEQVSTQARIALVTNGLSEVQRARIGRLGLGRLLDAVVISAEIGISKPHPAIFEAAVERLGNPPKRSALMIGDNLDSDIRGAAGVGIATCWYRRGGDHAPNAVADYRIGALAELPAIVAPRGRQ